MVERFILAIEGGGTRTRAALADSEGRVIARVEGRFSNLTSDFNASLQNIRDLIVATYDSAHRPVDLRANDVAIVGSAGANVGTVASRLAAALDFADIRVMSDREITVAGVLGTKDGTLAQVGTGSFFVSRYQGHLKQVGGWGFQLGDDCSGAWLGRELLRQTLRAHDGLADMTDLIAQTLGMFNDNPSDIVLFGKTATPQHFGEFAPAIFDALDSGDRAAAMIIDQARYDLEVIVRSLDAARTGRLYLGGSVGKRLAPLLSRDLGNLLTQSDGDGLSGAVSLGLELLRQLPPDPSG